MLDQRKLDRVLNTFDTLIEAISHFSNLLNENKFEEGVLLFSSVVEGYSAIKKNLNNLNLNDSQTKEFLKIEQSLLMIARLMEQGNINKLREIIQFSLMPQLINSKRNLSISRSPDYMKKQTVIGIYNCKENPIVVYPESRINALIREGESKSCKIYFFSSKDVNFEKREIITKVYKDGDWRSVAQPFPDVIHNIFAKARGKQSRVERKLRKEIPFTSFAIGNKFHLPKKFVETGKYIDLLVPFKIITDLDCVYEFLDSNIVGVFKPLLGRQGQNIYYVEKKNKGFIIKDHNKKQVYSNDKFKEWVLNIALKEKGTYMVQKYVHCRTKENEPYDIRAHVQKDGKGDWQLTKIYPRIGNKKSILSNISRGGRTENLELLFEKEYGVEGKDYLEKIQKLSLDITVHIDKIYGFAIDELGLDIAIDDSGRFWLHEVNMGPQTTYHEEERAVNTIAYADYIGKNQLFFTNEFEKKRKRTLQFDSIQSNIEEINLENKICVGMLMDPSEEKQLAVACAFVAKFEDIHFYYFTPNDIDSDEMLIRGYFYENNQWTAKKVKYPDVIYDRLRMKGYKQFHHIYDEFDGIPFTNEFFGNSISKLEVYDQIKAIGTLEKAIIPYKEVSRVKEIFHFLSQYGKVIVKPEIGSFARGVHYIESLQGLNYLVVEQGNEKIMDQMTLTNYLRELIKNGTFIVQKYIETRTLENQPFDIRVHMMKDGNKEWAFAMIYPRIGMYHAVISSIRYGGYISEIVGFLKRNFNEQLAHKIKYEIEELSIEVASKYEQLYEHDINELGLDIAIDKEGVIYLIEVNVNKPGINYYEFEVAKKAIPYAISLVKDTY